MDEMMAERVIANLVEINFFLAGLQARDWQVDSSLPTHLPWLLFETKSRWKRREDEMPRWGVSCGLEQSMGRVGSWRRAREDMGSHSMSMASWIISIRVLAGSALSLALCFDLSVRWRWRSRHVWFASSRRVQLGKWRFDRCGE